VLVSEDRVFEALEAMRTEVAEVTGGIRGLTDMVVTLQSGVDTLKSDVDTLKSDVDTLKADVREIRRDVSDLRSAMTDHLNWHLGQAS
jgi:uncharacterized protein YoxC